MFFSSWLRTRTRPGASEARRTSKPARRQATFRPRLEVLEGRDMPSTLTVTNNLDTGVRGDGSLRGEIAAAHSGDTIVFDPTKMTGQQIQLTSGSELYINTSLTIQGLPTQSVISGANHSRVFGVAAGVSVTLTNLTITGGTGITDFYSLEPGIMDGDGGGILNLGTLTLRGCTVSGNGNVFSPDHTRSGGGIYNAGTLTIDGGSVLSGNVAGLGAGIYNAGKLSMTDTTLSGNKADSDGGGLYNYSGATATLMNCTITGNTAGYEGGGIYSAKYGHLAVGGTQFSNNTPDNIFGSYSDKKGNTFL
jgi:hypothetical protein